MQYLLTSIMNFHPVSATTEAMGVISNTPVTTVTVAIVIIISTVIMLSRLLKKKDRTKQRIPNIPGPDFGDELYNLVTT